MDVMTITDIRELKAMAYDEQIALGRAQRNLDTLDRRIAQLETEGSAIALEEGEQPLSCPDDHYPVNKKSEGSDEAA